MGLVGVLSPPSAAPALLPSSSTAWKRKPPVESPDLRSGGRTLRFREICKGFPSCTRNGSPAFFLRSPLCACLETKGAAPAGTVSPLKASTAARREGGIEDKRTVFVAGATGRVGSRTVRELLKLGFQVRAASRSTRRAEALVESVKQMNLDREAGSPEIQPMQNLEIVVCNLENRESIRAAIGDSSIVFCSVGASEKDLLDATGPYRIDYRATKNLIDAATVAKVEHFILVTSLGTNKIGFPASLLNLFWGVLVWKRKAEEHLIASGIPYTIVRPGGMERPTDSFKETHNLVLANEDTYFGGLVSNLQVAELVGVIAANRKLSCYKVIEVVAETTAPRKPVEELLSRIPAQKEIPEENGGFAAATFGEDRERKPKPLSPYAMYEDLKPPASPTPAPSKIPTGSKAAGSLQVAQMLESIISSVPGSEVTEKGSTRRATSRAPPLSPYTAYEDLKPPTTPTPSPAAARRSL